MGEGGQRHASAALPPQEIDPILGTPQRRSGRMRKISTPAGIDPRTVQTVATCPYKQSIKDTGAKFYANLFGGSRAVTSRQANGQTRES
jgi:hypothetical protein